MFIKCLHIKAVGDVRFNFSNCFRLGKIQGCDVVAAIIEGIQLMSSIPKFPPNRVCFWLRTIQDKMYLLDFSFYFLKSYKVINPTK